jgi:hypothetical protein
MTMRRLLLPAALALLTVAGAILAATDRLPGLDAETTVTCSSCDARHRNIARPQTVPIQEPAP